MNIAQVIADRLARVSQGWTSRQNQIDDVKQDVTRLESQVEELKTIVKEQAPTALDKVFESRGKQPMKTIQDRIYERLTTTSKSEAPNRAVQIAIASLKKKDMAAKWRFVLKKALAKGNYSFIQTQAMIAKFEQAVKATGDYEKSFVEIVETYGNSDSQKELRDAKASFYDKA